MAGFVRILSLLMCVASLSGVLLVNGQSQTPQSIFDDFDDDSFDLKSTSKADFLNFKTGMQEDFYNFVDSIVEDHHDFRRKAIEDFAEFARSPWLAISQKPSYKRTVIERLNPDDMPDDASAHPQHYVTHQPYPDIAPSDFMIDEQVIEFDFFGSRLNVRFPMGFCRHFPEASEGGVADMLENLASVNFDNLLLDCLDLRASLNLCDWAYFLLVQTITQAAVSDVNMQTLVFSLLFQYSGYKVRLATDSSRLYALIGSDHLIYEAPVYEIDGDLFYCFEPVPHQISVCAFSLPVEAPLSLSMQSPPKFSDTRFKTIRRASEKYPEMAVSVPANKNILDFYATYPPSEIGGDLLSRWAIYANTELSPMVHEALYSALAKAIKGKSDVEAANMLLDFVQTGFLYEIDNNVSGNERIFFPEESLFSSYSDCEDRAILYTRLVRDLLHLDCALVFYPGHLAAALRIDGDIPGDTFTLDGHRYIIADPTCRGDPLGVSLPGVDNSSARLIKL